MISEKPSDVIDAATTGPRLGSNDLGAETMGVEDRTFRGSRFAEVEAALFENPYQRIWGADGEPSLPIYKVALPNLLRGRASVVLVTPPNAGLVNFALSAAL